jgi:D-glycero-beta-D-manno-heptose 1-phosphate adenylyltransferase
MSHTTTPLPQHSLLTTAELDTLLATYRKTGKSIVLTQGSFDMVHIGHARYLEKAKTHGDILIVGVDSDEKIKHRKGPNRPVVPQDERLEMLAYLKPVDHVVLKELSSPKWELISAIRPDVLIATSETYTQEQLQQLKEFCKKIVVLKPMATTSTSAKIRRVQIGIAKDMGNKLAQKLVITIEEVLDEFKRQ